MISYFKNPRALFLVLLCGVLASCTVNKQISKQAKQLLIDSAVSTGHIGISIYDPASGKYLYNHNATQYFIPASNAKLFTLYAGMKYLGDSLVGAYLTEAKDSIYLLPTGDPTFLHPEYSYQALYLYLKNSSKKISVKINIKNNLKPWGKGWAGDDYLSDYAVERSEFPIYGNIIRFRGDSNKISSNPFIIKSPFFKEPMMQLLGSNGKVEVTRKIEVNEFSFNRSNQRLSNADIPFVTGVFSITAVSFLQDTLKRNDDNCWYDYNLDTINLDFMKVIHSQPSDSLFKPMMHRSDNFFAEQTLLMASNEYLGYMSDEKIIDTILKSSLKDVPQKPKWVDGSGLSRYNLFTPQSFVYILNKMKDEFGLERMKVILATGGEGTLSAYYKNIAGNIYAKTGTLSNNCALSGYLITAKGKLLIFSVLNNNYITGATSVRRSVEHFLNYIQKKF